MVKIGGIKMTQIEVEVTYQPVVRYNKYGLSVRKTINYNSSEMLAEKIKRLQAYIRKMVKEQIEIDIKVK